MKIVLLAMILLSACHSKNEMTLEQLKKAAWTKLDTGIEYISLNEGKKTDSIRYNISQIVTMGMTVIPDTFRELKFLPAERLTNILNSKLPNCTKGYLKLDLDLLFQTPDLTASVYLNGDEDSLLAKSYVEKIRNFEGVRDAKYISKEMAKEKYLGDSNDDWKKVLTENPLPASIEVTLADDLTPEFLENLKQKLLSEIPNVSDIRIPLPLFNNVQSLKRPICYVGFERF